MNLYLDAPSIHDVECVRHWRNTDDVRPTLRTPYMLTQEQQAAFYRDVVCNRLARSRWWSVLGDGELAAFAGLTDIDWVAGHAEISLVVHPEMRGRGVGARAVELVLREAFERLRLVTVCAEVYATNPGRAFWRKMANRYGEGDPVILPRRKFWAGRHHDAEFYHFTKDVWKQCAAS